MIDRTLKPIADRRHRKLDYPFACRGCGVSVASAEERYRGWARCRPCGLSRRREIQARVEARKRGEDVPLRGMGAQPVAYPFPCKDCGGLVNDASERYFRWMRCRPCGLKWARGNSLKVRYGITPAQRMALDVEGDGKCWICRQGPGRRGLVVDHDHATNAVRGLLCHSCNRLLGEARDSIITLRAAIEYLERER